MVVPVSASHFYIVEHATKPGTTIVERKVIYKITLPDTCLQIACWERNYSS